MYIIDNLHIKIKNIAGRKNIALKALAIDMDMTEQGLHNILKRGNMPLDKFLSMANGLDMQPSELLNAIIKDTNPMAVNDTPQVFIKASNNYEDLMKQVIITNKIIENLILNNK